MRSISLFSVFAVGLVCVFTACGVQPPVARVAPEGPAVQTNPATPPAASAPVANPEPPPEPTPEATGPTGPTGPSTGACDMRQVTPVQLCDDDFVPVGEPTDWRHPWATGVVTAQGGPRHRGIDTVVNPNNPQWLIGKFAYGRFNDDLKDETVEVWLQNAESCGWTKLGEALTSNTDTGDIIEGIADTGGRVFYEIPLAQRLGVGTYRVKMLVKGDHSAATFTINVWPAGTSFSVTDMDGTMTTKEADGLWTAFDPASPTARPYAVDFMNAHASKNIRPVFLTARPEWMTVGTRQWLVTQGYAFGPLRLSESTIGLQGEEAVAYKGEVVGRLVGQGFNFVRGIGNRWSDYEAYVSAGIAPEDILLFDEGDIGGPTPNATLHEDYEPFLTELLCESVRP